MHRLRVISRHLQINNDNKSSLTSLHSSNERKYYGGDLVAYVLKELGVTSIFTLTGGHISPILCGSEMINIKVIDVRDEVTTVFAADAQSRINNKNNKPIPGIAVVTAGPGLTNTITAVKNAQMAESPVIIFGGATTQMLKNRGSLQDIDQIALIKPHCKWYKTLKSLKDVIPTVYEAFKISLANIPGPVFIECPLDVLYSQINVNKFNAYCKYKLPMNAIYNFDNIFHCKPDYDLILNKLSTCNKPLMIIGSQMINAHYNDDQSINKLLNNLNILNIPIYLSGMARGLTGVKHRLHFRHKRRNSVKECDLLFLLGVSCDFRLGYGRGINKKAYVIMVNIDKNKLKKNNDWRQKDLLYEYHPAVFMQNLCDNINKNVSKSLKYNNWMNILNDRENKRENEIDLMMIKNETNLDLKTVAIGNNNLKLYNELFVDPIRCCRIINDVINNDTLYKNEDIYIIADGGDFVGTASYIIKPSKYLHWLDPGPFGTLGCGAGFAIGIKSLKPNSTVIVLYGDGAFGWSCIEFDTLARHKLNVIAIIGNDACWTQIARDQVKRWGMNTATKLNYTNYESVVKPFGCKGICVKTSNELKPALNLALSYTKQGYSVVINVITSTSNFRETSISV